MDDLDLVLGAEIWERAAESPGTALQWWQSGQAWVTSSLPAYYLQGYTLVTCSPGVDKITRLGNMEGTCCLLGGTAKATLLAIGWVTLQEEVQLVWSMGQLLRSQLFTE